MCECDFQNKQAWLRFSLGVLTFGGVVWHAASILGSIRDDVVDNTVDIISLKDADIRQQAKDQELERRDWELKSEIVKELTDIKIIVSKWEPAL